MKRIFTAIKITPDKPLTDFILKTQKSFPGAAIKWVESFNHHITLFFYGETEEKQISDIIAGLKGIADSIAPFQVFTGKAGYFGSIKSPKVLWLEMLEPTGELMRLQSLVKEGAVNAGIHTDDKPFRIHLTLGRVHNSFDERLLKNWLLSSEGLTPQTYDINEIILFESKLTPRGPVYSSLQVCKLGSV